MIEHDDREELLPLSKLTAMAFFPCLLHGGRRDYMTLRMPPSWWKVHIPKHVQYAMEAVGCRDLWGLQGQLQLHRDPTDYKFLSTDELNQLAHAMVEARKMRWKRIQAFQVVKIHRRAVQEERRAHRIFKRIQLRPKGLPLRPIPPKTGVDPEVYPRRAHG